MSVIESTLPLQECKMCYLSENHTELFNIMELGPEKEDISQFIDMFYKILQMRQLVRPGDLLCFNCLTPFLQFLRKGKLLFESRSKMQQVKNLPQTDLSEFHSNINLQKESDFNSIAESSLEPIAGSSMTLINKPSFEPIAGPSGVSSAGSSRSPIADISLEKIAELSLEPIVESSRALINKPSFEPIAGPSGTSSAGSSRSTITGFSSEQIPRTSWALHSESSWTRSFRATIAKPSTSSSFKSFLNPSDVVVNKKKRKIRNYNNTCPFCHSQDVNNRDFQFDSTTELCSRHTQPYTCLLKDCKIVFPNRDVFVPHYRYHLKLTKQTYLCRTCFAVLNCSRNVKRDAHKHQDTSKMYCCCSDTFPSMTDFVLHKLLKHSLEVIVIMSHGQMKEYSKDEIHPLNPLCATTMTQNRQFIQTSIQLFTCTVEYCGRVFDTASTNVEHFKEHAKIPVTCSVCSICLLQSDIPDFHLNCNHINPQIACKFCKCGFDTLHDLAFHKFTNHLSVILCGPDKVQGCTVCGIKFKNYENPFDHYISKCFSNENWDIKSNKFEKIEPSFDSVVKLSSSVNSQFGGSYMCKDCGVHFYSLNMYLEHVKTHGLTYHSREIFNIVMCPICDKNYDRSDFLKHLDSCTSGMKLNENTYGCAHCQKRLVTSESWKFRVHHLFCRSFETIIDDNSNTPWYKCLNCTFKSTNLSICLGHGCGTCIYFKLKMRYSMSMDEVQKVEDRKKEILKYSLIDLKPQNEYKHFFNPKCCNRNRQKLLESFDYYCMFCKKGFYSDYIFDQHLNVHGYQCRPVNIVYCRYCVCDFDSIENFTSHASGMLIDPPIEPTGHRPIKCEDIDEISITEVEISTENVEMPTGGVDISTEVADILTPNMTTSTGQDFELNNQEDEQDELATVYSDLLKETDETNDILEYTETLKLIDPDQYGIFIKNEVFEEASPSHSENSILLHDGMIGYDFEEVEEEVTIDEDQKPDLNSLNPDIN